MEVAFVPTCLVSAFHLLQVPRLLKDDQTRKELPHVWRCDSHCFFSAPLRASDSMSMCGFMGLSGLFWVLIIRSLLSRVLY